MNLTKIKKALAHATEKELGDLTNWITGRVAQLAKRDSEAKQDAAWGRVKHLKPGDYAFVCATNMAAWKKGTRVTVERIMPRKRYLLISVGKNRHAFSASTIAMMDIRPSPTDEVREAAMRLLLEQ